MDEEKPSELDLEQRLRETVSSLQESTIEEVNRFFHLIEEEVSKTLMHLADSIVSKLRESQKQFDIEASIRERPLTWLISSMLAGSAAALIRSENLTAKKRNGRSPKVNSEDLH